MKTTRIAFAFLFTSLVLTACVATEVRGTLRAEGGTSPGYEATFSGCASGERKQFYGVELFAPARPDLYVAVLQDPFHGVSVALTDPATKRQVVLERAVCSQLDVKIHHHTRNEGTSRYPRYVKVFDGYANVDCVTPELGRVHGGVTWEYCD